jgi:hypothetical protein
MGRLRGLGARARRLWASRAPGQALVYVTVMILTLLAFVAIATDTGMIWLSRRYLQNAADSAALAGAQQLPDDTAGAEEIACAYGTTDENYVDVMFGKSGDCASRADVTIGTKYVPNDTITVTTYRTVTPLFGQIIGFDDVEVWAKATAVLGSIAAACPFPIFQAPEMLPTAANNEIDFYTLVAMHLSGADNQQGNFLTIDVGSGANAVLDAMVNNTCGTPITETVDTEPGGKIGKVVDGFQWRVHCATGSGTKPGGTPACPAGMPPSACPNPELSLSTYLVTSPSGAIELSPTITRDNCPRLVVLPILQGPFDAINGREDMTLLGFALYYIAGVCPPTGNDQTCTHPTLGELQKGDSWGYFVRMTGTSSDYSAYNGFGTKVVALID